MWNNMLVLRLRWLRMLQLLFLFILPSLRPLHAEHFYGATISWSPVLGMNNTAKFDFKAGWKYNAFSSPGCTLATLGQLKFSGAYWNCLLGCTTANMRLASLNYYCTAVSSQKTFEMGENSFNYTFLQPQAQVGYIGFSWRKLHYYSNTVNATGNDDLSWSIVTDVDLRRRSDIGRPNSSPVGLSRPVYRLQFGCNHTVKLQLNDPNDDVVKCRWASGTTECADVCQGIPGTRLDEDTCTLSIDSQASTGFISGGWYAVALTIEDFPRTDVTLDDGTVKNTTSPLSSVPLQFLVEAFYSNDACDAFPEFLHPTPADGLRIPIPLGSSFALRIYAHRVKGGQHDIIDFTVLGPRGITNTKAANDTIYNRSGAFFSQLTWNPTDNQVKDHIVCFSADDDKGKTSVTRCVTLAVGDVDDCAAAPCVNGATCHDIRKNFRCECLKGYTGRNCETNIDDCQPKPCHNSATCTDGISSYTCTCAVGYTGTTCSNNIDDCQPNPCVAGGTCRDGLSSFKCTCPPGRKGRRCEVIENPCKSAPCLNRGACLGLPDGISWVCQCLPGYTGSNCGNNINDCKPNPCHNGGTCTDGVNNVTCSCPVGRKGARCEVIKNPCNAKSCLNGGTCLGLPDGINVVCNCLPGYTDSRCGVNIDDCRPKPCHNGGTCTDRVNNVTCSCPVGRKGARCEVITNPCNANSCLNGGTCLGLPDGISVVCKCLPGYTDSRCGINIDDCRPKPCQNGGTCTDEVNSFRCMCPPGRRGKTCEGVVNPCKPTSCHNNGTCVGLPDGIDFVCQCLPGYTGLDCSKEIDHCRPNPCHGGATCASSLKDFRCTCPAGRSGQQCEHAMNLCNSTTSACHHGGTCFPQPGGISSICVCAQGYTGSNCSVHINECYPNPCQGGGNCTNLVNSFSCACTSGRDGKRCENVKNPCHPTACLNRGTCVAKQDGVTYICQCQPGYKGHNCNTIVDNCLLNPCQGGGKCANLRNDFKCTCDTGRYGKRCENIKNPCNSSKTPCQHGGTCVAKQDGVNYICQCSPGFEGWNCSTNINECQPNPCQEAGNCTDLRNDFSCTCTHGRHGKRCEKLKDPCNSTLPICNHGGTCIPKQDGIHFYCVCPIGYTGPNCNVDIDKCTSNHCQGGGTCSNVASSTTQTTATVCTEIDIGPMCPRMARDGKCSLPDVQKYCRKSCLC